MKANNNNIVSWTILFLIWPFGAFILSLFNGLKRNTAIVIYMFSFLLGYQAVVSGHDMEAYRARFESLSGYVSWSKLFQKLMHLYSSDQSFVIDSFSEKPDIYADLVHLLSSSITTDVRLFWGIISLVYTFFFIETLKKLHKRIIKINEKHILIIAMLLLIYVIPFSRGVTGIRFWTAFWMFNYGVVMSFEPGNRKKLIFCFLTPLVHYSFLLGVGILLISRISAFYKVFSHKWFIPVVTVIALAISQSAFVSILIDLFSVMDEGTISSSSSGYFKDEKLTSGINHAGNWYINFNYYGFQGVVGFIYLLFSFSKKSILSPKLISLTNLFYMLYLFTLPMSVTYHRFNYIFCFLALYSLVLNYPTHKVYIKRLLLITLPFLILRILVHSRIDFYLIDIQFLLDNIVTVFMEHSNVSLSEFIIGH